MVTTFCPFFFSSCIAGMWQNIFEVLSVAAVITNCGIVAFTSAQLKSVYDGNYLRILAVVVVAEHILLLAKWAVAKSIPDTPGAHLIYVCVKCV